MLQLMLPLHDRYMWFHLYFKEYEKTHSIPLLLGCIFLMQLGFKCASEFACRVQACSCQMNRKVGTHSLHLQERPVQSRAIKILAPDLVTWWQMDYTCWLDWIQMQVSYDPSPQPHHLKYSTSAMSTLSHFVPKENPLSDKTCRAHYIGTLHETSTYPWEAPLASDRLPRIRSRCHSRAITSGNGL